MDSGPDNVTLEHLLPLYRTCCRIATTLNVYDPTCNPSVLSLLLLLLSLSYNYYNYIITCYTYHMYYYYYFNHK